MGVDSGGGGEYSCGSDGVAVPCELQTEWGDSHKQRTCHSGAQSIAGY